MRVEFKDLLKKAQASDSMKLLAHLKFPGERSNEVKKGAHWAETFTFLPGIFSEAVIQNSL